MRTRVNGNRVFYTDSGNINGIPIILIHGFPFSHKMWDAQVKVLENKFRVITYDVRGHGDSGVGDYQYMIDLFVDDLFALMDNMKIDKAIVCGLSMGGYIALRAIERIQERFLGLILCDTRSEGDSNEAKEKRYNSLRDIKRNGLSEYSENSLKAVFRLESFGTHKSEVGLIRKLILDTSPKAICGTLIAMSARPDTTGYLDEIKVPTLIMVGEDDQVTPPIAAQSMYEKITGSELHLIPSAGHMSNLENSGEFNRVLLDFLNRF